MATSSLHLIDGVPATPQPNDLSRSLVALDQNSTIIAVVELSQSSWLVGGVVPGIELVPMRRLRPRRVPPAASYHKAARVESLPSRASFAKDIAVFEIALGEFEHGCVADRTDLQPSDIGAAERCCGGGCARSDYIDQLPFRGREISTSSPADRTPAP